jgi:putative oxidoreductase
MGQQRPTKTLWWIAKGFISFFMVFSAWYSYTHAQDLMQLGFPDYFRIELVTAKLIGAIVLLIPQTPPRVKEWVYAGFVIAMVSALVAHICSSDPVSKIIFVTVDLIIVLLAMNYVSGKELKQNNTNKII